MITFVKGLLDYEDESRSGFEEAGNSSGEMHSVQATSVSSRRVLDMGINKVTRAKERFLLWKAMESN